MIPGSVEDNYRAGYSLGIVTILIVVGYFVVKAFEWVFSNLWWIIPIVAFYFIFRAGIRKNRQRG